MSTRTTTGIRIRHQRDCRTGDGGRCSCKPGPTYEASVWDGRQGRKIRKSFPTLQAAKSWRADAQGGVERGTLRAAAPKTLREAAEEWLTGVEEGQVRTRSGDEYKPSALRGYEASLRRRILPDLGARQLVDVQRRDLQGLVERLLREGLDPSTIRNTLMPLRAIYRRAVSRGDVTVNPTSALELPAVRGRRDRIASPGEAAALITALPLADRALWATALYGGLRRGELMALRWEDVDLAAGVIRVERAWDVKAGIIEPKSQAGRRRVPIAAALREELLDHKLRTGRDEGLVFGRSRTNPFNHSSVLRRALTAWQRAGLQRIGLHESRHTFASLMIAAGVNAKALSTYLGHSSITITLDRYGHLMPGNEDEAAGLLDAYLERSNTQARLAQVSSDA